MTTKNETRNWSDTISIMNIGTKVEWLELEGNIAAL